MAFERKLCGYVNVCATENDAQCLTTSASTTSAPIVDTFEDDETDDKPYSCWTKSENKMIKNDYRVKFPNGTQILNSENLTGSEAKRRCLVLGVDVCQAFTNMMTGSNKFALRSVEWDKESAINRYTYSLSYNCRVKDCSVLNFMP